MKARSTSIIRGHVVDVLLTHTVRSESKVCAVPETAKVDKVPSGRAFARDFMEEE
jgi:hypothetical protein